MKRIGRTKELHKYFISILNDLDGYGIIFTDEILVREQMKEYGDFLDLQEIFRRYPVKKGKK
jgi:hypothetical protein